MSVANVMGIPSEHEPITTYLPRISEDNRRVYYDAFTIDPPSPVKRQRRDLQAAHASQGSQPAAAVPPPSFPDVDPGQYMMDCIPEDDDGQAEPAATRTNAPRVYKPSDPALHRFRAVRDEYLQELLRREGCCTKEDITNICGVCKKPADAPLTWNGHYFEKTTPKAIGLRVQLGHPPGTPCLTPRRLHHGFVVLHTNGVHEVDVYICDCERACHAGPAHIQMLRAGWFPATDDLPRTCATFECLDLFTTMTLQAKTTTYDFYGVLQKLTDNTGGKVADRYAPLLRMVREWAHLQMLKRGGMAHEAGGVDATTAGALAVNTSPADQFLYISFIAIDACFRLKRRMISNEIKDPSLGPGWSYFVESAPYREHLRGATDQKEMSTCSGLAALDHANTKFSRGYSSTGVGMGVCARHEFVQPTGVGDLQKGERYVNMDYIFASLLRHTDPRLFRIVSYDIVCQWWKNLVDRLKELPPLVRIASVMRLMRFWRFVIPKMHIQGHMMDCQITYSLNYIPGSAQTDGEGIERPWANFGSIANSTREMGPGSREDVLNHHMGYWNWQKLIGLADRLRTRLDRAESEYAAQLEGFTEFSQRQRERVPDWQLMVDKWEADPQGAPNPYKSSKRKMSEKEVLLQLEREDAERVKAGIPTIHNVSPSSFLAAGLEVEDEQRRVRVQIQMKRARTTAQDIDIAALRRKLARHVARLRLLQQTYTPASILALNAREAPEDEQVEDEPLFLPSALSVEQRRAEPLAGLAVMEDMMRDAQCECAIDDLRRQLTVKSRLLTYKRVEARHQGMNTRARSIVNRNEVKIRLHSEKYQAAWEAKRRLCGGDPTKVGWGLLRREDVRCMEDAAEVERSAASRKAKEDRRRAREAELQEIGEMLPPREDEGTPDREAVERGGESVRRVSWIWTGADSGNEDLDEALRIEWCKANARTRRWREEIRLLEEEQRRLPIALMWQSRLWENRVRKVPVGVWDVEFAEGGVAYALKQAAIFRDLAERAEATRTEIRRGKGRARQRVREDEIDVGGIWGDENVTGLDQDEEELEECRGGLPDEEHILAGGEDD
ncbi:hypothetical protein FB45DRAFT_1011540 [Roridomyces roridus]|uniref:CxC2-like cysteine cluster KDZ transposase-associated domain-containing protein n=1 Tax=Roridomyces roridus TaxID=1738132 RepID=A0AAD7F9F7_9AGAR|nr:hypothetical protein FB45DRAFT_1011540 [Roridomyces roridus]